MLKRFELLNQDSCLNKADANEPVFVLRAKDTLAPATIRHWATMAQGTHEQAKIDEALTLAQAMEDWRDKTYPVFMVKEKD